MFSAFFASALELCSSSSAPSSSSDSSVVSLAAAVPSASLPFAPRLPLTMRSSVGMGGGADRVASPRSASGDASAAGGAEAAASALAPLAFALALAAFAFAAAFEPLRAYTTLLAASTSSITNIRSENFILIGKSPPWTGNTKSKRRSISSWFVLILARFTDTTCRFRWCANALIRDVLPVPGGPSSSSPSLSGKPSMANLPSFRVNWSIRRSSCSFSGKNRDSNVFWSDRRYCLNWYLRALFPGFDSLPSPGTAT
mmetsp:Transcript_42145/g.109738  ORF Transcript_42145/g.109738 Transcript_42145/m.109738 type:complete len:256 (+) Transcript_42145:523-1290(+)